MAERGEMIELGFGLTSVMALGGEQAIKKPLKISGFIAFSRDV